MITDRDICIATATRSAIPSEIRVRDVISGRLYIRARPKTMSEPLSGL
jgi:hypothetical protein